MRLSSIDLRPRRFIVITVIALILLGVSISVTLRVIASRQVPDIQFVDRRGTGNTLVVAVHGANGTDSRTGLLALVREEYPNADVIAPVYFAGRLGILSNADPYAQADALEDAINRQFRERQYEKIVLVGHSFGAILLRKVIVWASGDESDRPGSRRGQRNWVHSVDRFVSLAGINRGWTVDPKPEQMEWWAATALRMGERIARWTGVGGFILGFQRGSPFVADLRIQWMNIGRRVSPLSDLQQQPPPATLPPTIHILGTKDDIVSNEDSRDICVAEGVKFVTLPDTGHKDIASIVATNGRSYRAQVVRHAVGGDPNTLEVDETVICPQNRKATRLLFILHGIRDYADWGERLADEIAAAADSAKIPMVVEPPKYGWFPMAPFLLQPDRQQKVRWFMDQYTDAMSRYPNANEVDLIGHSHGTYLLGAALVRYRTIRIRNAYLAGSVLPERFPWQDFVPSRVRSVRNVVGAEDWVVGIFPRLYEQLAEWFGVESVGGVLDIGAAGFRGFQKPAGGAVRNIKFAAGGDAGGHSTGVDLQRESRRHALVTFAVDGLTPKTDAELLRAFENTRAPNIYVDWASRVSWLVWALLTLLFGGSIVVAWCFRRWVGVVWAFLILGMLNSI